VALVTSDGYISSYINMLPTISIKEFLTVQGMISPWNLKKKYNTKTLTHYRPEIPFGNRKKLFYRIFSVRYCYNLKNITPLET